MRFKIDILPRTLKFKRPAGTSRGVYTVRKVWYVVLRDAEEPGRFGVGECAPLVDLSCDYCSDDVFERRLRTLCDMAEKLSCGDEPVLPYEELRPYPSMLFGLETAVWHWKRHSVCLSDTEFGRGKRGIEINGLIWMGSFEEMKERIEEKLRLGFGCIKLKIGAIDFDSELNLIRMIRGRFSKDDIELRVDANGAFSPDDALFKLEQLAKYDLHSIEQPIKAGQWDCMARLCADTPLPIALDEELIGVNELERKNELLDTIRPQYIILKPSLHGGIAGAEEWVGKAEERRIGWWATSALESNVGLNAIAHWCAVMQEERVDACLLPQGLGTGQLFVENVAYPLEVRGDKLWFDCAAAHSADTIVW